MKQLRKFKGIELIPFRLTLNPFDGYSITIIKIGWVLKGKICMIGNSWCLLNMGFYNSTDDSFIFTLNILGIKKRWFIKPRIIDTCPNCNHKIQIYEPIDNEVYCDECDSWIDINEIKTLKLYREGEFT